MKRIIIGVDLSLTSKSVASIYCPSENRYYGKSISFDNSFQGYEYLLSECEKRREEEVQLEFVMEPTGLIWMPLSCYLITKGHIVYRVTTQKTSDFRKFISKHSKSDKIDSKTMAKLPIVASEEIYEIYLPKTDLGILCRKTKYMAKLVQEISSHKQRIQGVFDMINPGVLKIFGDNRFNQTGRIFFRYFSNTLKIIELGNEGFIKAFKELSKKAIDDAKLERIYAISAGTINIYKRMLEKDSLPFSFAEEAAMIQNELDIIEFIEERVKCMEKEIQILYKKIDNNEDLRSIQGIGIKIAPAILGIIGDVTRFKNIGSFKKYSGFVSKKSQSSEKDKKGLKIDKAAQSLLKASLYMAAETARKWDVEFAHFYDRLIKKGLHHISAVSALANKMAGRIYAVLKRMQLSNNSNYAGYCNTNDYKSSIKPDKVRYVMKDMKGKIITKKQARAIVLEKYPGKNKKASLRSQNNLSKQFSSQKGESSSRRSCRTRQAKYILNDIFNDDFFQDNSDPVKIKMLEKLRKLLEESERNDVDNLLVTGG